MKIGVVAVQGAFIEHQRILEKLNVEHFLIRQKKDLDRSFDGLIFPGGESTAMGKLFAELDLFQPLNTLLQSGFPAFGTCAGLILLAEKLSNDEKKYFATMPLTVKRNAYGRQLGSFETKSDFADIGQVPMVFIRAPYIEQVRGDTKILATVNGHIVAARYRNQLGTAFHPELTDDISVHEYFTDMIAKKV
jgi:5'-phosphate synthase pdxT subunit